jgi:hypothetical protein
MDKVMNGQAQLVPIPTPLATALADKYHPSINRAGLDRAAERAAKIRAAADSARAQQQPRSEVPLPGTPNVPPPRDTGRPARPQQPAPNRP